MPRILKIYVSEGFDREKLKKVRELASSVSGGTEPVRQRLLMTEPTSRQWHKFELPDSIEATFAVNELVGDKGFEIVEDSDAG